MPARVWPLWFLTAFIIVGFPILNFIYWPEAQRSGVLPPDGDTVIIPMFGSIVVALLASPLVLLAAWLCLRCYNPEARIAAWRADRPLRTALATLTLGGTAVLLAVSAIAAVTSALPWHEHLWTAYSAVLVYWLLALRASAIEQLKSGV